MMELSDFVRLLHEMKKQQITIPGDLAFESAGGTENAQLIVTYSPETGVYSMFIEIAEDISRSEGEHTFTVCRTTSQNEVAWHYTEAVAGLLEASRRYSEGLKAARKNAWAALREHIPRPTLSVKGE